MRVRTMQVVDRWVGVPLCFLFTSMANGASFCVAGLRRVGVIAKKVEATKPRSIILVELSEMGSAILAYSSIVRLKESFPDAQVRFLIFQKNRESCDVLGVFKHEDILTISDRSFFALVLSTLKVLWQMRSLGVDTIIDLELFSRFTALLTFLSGAKNKVGFHGYTNEGVFRGNFLTHKVLYNSHQHMVYNFLALTLSLVAKGLEVPLLKRDVRPLALPLPRYVCSIAEKQKMSEVLGRFNRARSELRRVVVLNPDPGDALPIRGWPLERYVELANQILVKWQGAEIAVIGLKASKSYAEAIIHGVTDAKRVVDLTGSTATLGELLCVMESCSLLITNDSGPAHLASLVGIPTVALFGPETPALYGPVHAHSESLFAGLSCSPCLSATNHRHSPCSDSQCLKVISVSQVMEAAERVVS